MIWSTDDIADDWPLVPLESIATKVGSGATPRGGRAAYPDEGIPLIRSQNVRFEGFTENGLAFLTEAQAARLDGARVAANDVLLNITGASIGRVCVAPEGMDGARVNQHVCIIRTPAVEPAFLAAYLASPQVQGAIAQGNYGATREALTKAQILEMPVPTPPPAEQRAIIEVIGLASAKLRNGVAHAALARSTLQELRTAALNAAASGILTADWREENAADVSRLLEELRHQANGNGKPVPEPDVDALGELPPEWPATSLGLLIDRIEAGKSVRAEGRAADESEWGVIKVSAMSWGTFLEDENKAVLDDRLINREYEIRAGDLLFSRANTEELVGATVLVSSARDQLLLSDKSLRLVPREGIDKAWLNYILASGPARRQFSERATGTSDSMRNLSQQKILATTLPLPGTNEQAEIARRVDAILQLGDLSEARLTRAEQKLDHARRAILGKAFRGELMPQDSTDALARDQSRP